MAVKFHLCDGTEIPAVSGEQMREIDRVAMEHTGPNLFQMMENAGRDVATFVCRQLGVGWQKARIAILAGSGGNGGGGICAGRHLSNHGAQIDLYLANPAHLSDIAAFQRKVYSYTRGHEISLAGLERNHYEFVIDALIGYGLHTAPRREMAELIELTQAKKTALLSLDVPSGVDATTGEIPGVPFRPDFTLTLALPKTGLLSADAGELYLADIGIPPGTYERLGIPVIDFFGDRYWVPLLKK